MAKIIFNQADKTELCQISLTGLRSLVLLELLMKAPRSLEEIRNAFIECNIMGDDNSDDILRIDLNTLRSMGCEISRSCKKTNSKHILIKHPFAIKFEKEEISILKRAYKQLSGNLSLEKLIEYDILFKKLAANVMDEDIKQQILGISSITTYNSKLLKELMEDCKKQNEITLEYKAPTSKNKQEKVVIAKEIAFQSEKLYLRCIDKNSKEALSLNIKRILDVVSRKDSEDGFETAPIVIRFKLKDFGITGLDKNETIIEKNENGYIIEGKYHNEFLATQRILSFGSNCTVIEPNDFKEKIIALIKKMREIYNG